MKLNETFAYILGFTFGDGNLSRNDYLVRLYDANNVFVQKVLARKFADAFGVTPNISFDRSNNSYVLFKRSEKIWRKLREYGVPDGKKARTIKIGKIITNADRNFKLAFCAGICDAEGTLVRFTEPKRHPHGYWCFTIKMYSPKFVDKLSTVLVDANESFNPRVYHYNYGSILRLNGFKQIELLRSTLKPLHPRFNWPAR